MNSAKNLRSVDLNLLVILDALLTERSVTRAAARLYLTQPATSHALERLRLLFGDPLLERRKGGMELTGRAEELREPLRDVLDELQRLVQTPDIPLAELRQTVHLAMPDFPAILLLPQLWPALQRVAPGVNLVVHNWTDNTLEIARLQKGEISLVLSTLETVPSDVEKQHIGDECYTGIAALGHALGAQPSLEEFTAWPHVLVSARGSQSTPFDRQLAALGVQRRVGMSVSSFLSVPSIVASSDAIALIPRSMARHWADTSRLQEFTPPVDAGSFSVDLAWHKRRSTDKAVQLVAGLVATLMDRIVRQTGVNPA
ncbi:LysR family transcriptional regulator [Undibacterium sp. TJN25]|uniref:LysR family transcriptional regulator n=1 Tax=Undibacterium sp. TJN25 TaxID=3413056 RepID=UPI003BF08DB4